MEVKTSSERPVSFSPRYGSLPSAVRRKSLAACMDDSLTSSLKTLNPSLEAVGAGQGSAHLTPSPSEAYVCPPGLTDSFIGATIRKYLNSAEEIIDLPPTNSPWTDFETRNLAPILKASYAGDIIAMRLLIACGSSLDTKNDYGAGLIHFGAMGGHIEAIEFLLSQHLQIDALDAEGRSVEVYATLGGSIEMLNWLSRAKGRSLDFSSAVTGVTLAHWAAFRGHITVLEWLLKHSKLSLDITSSYGSTLAHYAAVGGQLGTLEWLEQQRSNDDVSVYTLKTNAGCNLATFAARRGHLHILEAFKDKLGEEVLLEKDNQGWNIAIWATRAGHLAVLQWIIAYCNVSVHALLSDADKQGENLAAKAARSGTINILDWIRSVGGEKALESMNGKTETYQWTVAHFASITGEASVLEWIWNSGDSKLKACLTSLSTADLTPAHVAAKHGSIDVLEWIFKCEDPQVLATLRATVNGATLAHLAASSGKIDTLKWLQSSSEPNLQQMLLQKDKAGKSISSRAAFAGHVSIIEWLHKSADPALQALLSDFGTKDGLHYRAAQAGHTKVLDWIWTSGDPVLLSSLRNSILDNTLVSYTVEQHLIVLLEWIVAHYGPSSLATALFTLASLGRVQSLEWMYHSGHHALLTQILKAGLYLPHIAASFDKPEILSWMVSTSDSSLISLLTAKDSSGNTPAAWAAVKGSINVLKWFHTSPNSTIRSTLTGTNDILNTLAHISATNGQLGSLQWIEASGDASLRSTLFMKNKAGQTPAQLALKYQLTTVVNWFSSLPPPQ